MRYHVIYKPGDVTYYTTNYSQAPVYEQVVDHEFMLNQPGSQVVTWELNDLPLTQKFMWNHKRTLQEYKTDTESKLNIATDVYSNPIEDAILKSRTQMNIIIDKFNNLEWGWFTIPESYKLDDVNINVVKIKELNALHDLFENNLPILSDKHQQGSLPEDVDYDEWYNNFQTINMMVHYNEKLFQYIDENNEACRQSLAKAHNHYFTSLKLNFKPSKAPERYYNMEMLTEDYTYFTYQKPKGWLELDFGTVGKDLLSCSWTDDIELVQRNACSQQLYHHPWVAFGWIHFENDIHHRNNLDYQYNKWIEENEVAKYLDLNDAKYTPGRHMLGHCISHDFDNPKEFMDTIIKDTPKVYGVILTDDDNKSIL